MLNNYKKSFFLLSVSVLFISVFTLNNCFAQWVDRSIPNSDECKVYALLLEGENFYAGTNGGGVFLSTDYGVTWTEKNTGLTDLTSRVIIRFNSELFLGTEGSGIFKSADNGENWTASSSGLPSGAEVVGLAALNSNIFAACKGGGMFLSADNGATWTKLTNGLTAGEDDFRGVAVLDNIVFAANDDIGFFKSEDNGASWSAINTGLEGKYLRCKGVMFSHNSDLYAGTKTGVVVTSDYGANWTPLGEEGLTDDDIRALAVTDDRIFVGTDEGGFFSSADGGANWTASTGCGMEIRNILLTGVGLFASGENGGIWLDPSIVSSVDKQLGIKPNQYTLFQNYPNPFNPSTTVEFNLTKSGHVSLLIYNMLGKEVALLINQEMGAGTHSVNWQANGVATGVYFYKIKVNNFATLRKMVLMR